MQDKKNKTKKNIKARDLKPRKDAKGGYTYSGPRPSNPRLNRPGGST
jgi:hypothetical protein